MEYKYNSPAELIWNTMNTYFPCRHETHGQVAGWEGTGLACTAPTRRRATVHASSLLPEQETNPTPSVFTTFLHFPLFLLLPVPAALLTCLGGMGSSPLRHPG
jgi:hypothetical protein